MSSSLNLPSQCNAYPPNADTTNMTSMGSALLNKMGMQQSGCDLSTFNAAVAGKGSAGPGGILGSMEMSAQLSGLKKSGCQVVAALLGNYMNSIYLARCSIENDSTNIVTTSTISQTANVEAVGPGSKVFCTGGINISQSGSITARSISKISSSSANTIAEIAQQGLSNTAAQIGKIKDGYQGTSSGAKSLQAIQSKLENDSQSTTVKNAITSVVNKFSIDQNGNIIATDGGIIMNSASCVITQTSLMDLQLANIISNAYSSSVSDSISAFLQSNDSQSTSLDSQGVPDTVGDMLKNNWALIAGAVVAVALGLFLVSFLKSKNAAKMMDTMSKRLPPP
jgi:hypothetical protein